MMRHLISSSVTVLVGALPMTVPGLCQSEPTGAITSVANGTVGIIEWVYPAKVDLTINYNDVLILSWWTNISGTVELEQIIAGGGPRATVSQTGTSAVTFSTIHPSISSYPATATFGLGVNAGEGGAYSATQFVVVTSTSGVPTTYASTTTGTAVTLPTTSTTSNTNAAGRVAPDNAWSKGVDVAAAVSFIAGVALMW